MDSFRFCLLTYALTQALMRALSALRRTMNTLLAFNCQPLPFGDPAMIPHNLTVPPHILTVPAHNLTVPAPFPSPYFSSSSIHLPSSCLPDAPDADADADAPLSGPSLLRLPGTRLSLSRPFRRHLPRLSFPLRQIEINLFPMTASSKGPRLWASAEGNRNDKV